jgi:hypothetical protein
MAAWNKHEFILAILAETYRWWLLALSKMQHLFLLLLWKSVNANEEKAIS